MSADAPVVSIKDISKVFGKGGITALEGIDLDEGPVVIDARVTKEESVYPMIAPGQAARDMVG